MNIENITDFDNSRIRDVNIVLRSGGGLVKCFLGCAYYKTSSFTTNVTTDGKVVTEYETPCEKCIGGDKFKTIN